MQILYSALIPPQKLACYTLGSGEMRGGESGDEALVSQMEQKAREEPTQMCTI